MEPRYSVTHSGYKRESLRLAEFVSIVTTSELQRIEVLAVGQTYKRPTTIGTTIPLSVERTQ